MLKKSFLYLLGFLVVFLSIPMYPVYAVPPEEFMGSLAWSKMSTGEKWGVIYNFSLAEIGAILTGDASSYINGMVSMREFINEHDPDEFVDDNNIITIPEDYIALLKDLLDQYAEENEPYYMADLLPYNYIPLSTFTNHKNVYDTMINLLNDSPTGIVAFGCSGGTMSFTDVGHLFTQLSPVKYNVSGDVQFFFNESWNNCVFRVWRLSLSAYDDAVKSRDEFADLAGNNYLQSGAYYVDICNHFGTMPSDAPDSAVLITSTGSQYDVLKLISRDRRRIRVFNTYGDFQNYTLGRRTVYYTPEYYDYVPADLTVPVEDLQKSIDGLSGVLEELLSKIDRDTPENEVEDLLKQILDELKNSSAGTGDGPGPGTNVTADMSVTNSWLSKIYAKVCGIFDRMSASVEDASGAALSRIQDTLDGIADTLGKIRRWSAVDTVIDGLDAVAGWGDFLAGILEDIDSGAQSAVAAVSGAMDGVAGLMKEKFPFCIPWDVHFLISLLAHEPEPPVFRLPVRIERLGIEEYIEVDMAEFSGLSRISRTLFTAVYCYALLNLTMKLFPAVREE